MRIDKDNIKIILILLIVGLGIGYAYINTNLNINGTANINSANWDVHWANVQVSQGSVSANTPTITNQTTVNYTVTLTQPGDYYEFTVDAVNSGTIDAMIETISSKLNGVTITTLPAYLEYRVTYSDGLELQTNQELLHDTTETYKVRIGYKTNINASDLPSTNQSLSLQFTVGYKQADENATEVDHGTTVYTVSNTSSYIGQAMPNSITQYSSASDAMAAFSNRPYYLRHLIRNGIIEESYVEFVVTQAMANNNPGMTPGTYALRGFVTYDENASSTNYCKAEYYIGGYCINPYYESNKQVLQAAFGNGNCYEYYGGGVDVDVVDYKSLGCSVSDFYAGASSTGGVRASVGSWICSVNYDGASDCGESYNA